MDGRAGTDTLGLIDALGGTVDLTAGTATARYRTFNEETGEQGRVEMDATLSGFENVWGSERADVIQGDNGANVLFGNPGADQIMGLAGNDTLDGGPEFNDSVVNTLDGGDGNDTCVNGDATNCEAGPQARTAGGRSLTRMSSAFTVVRDLLVGLH